MNLRKMQYIYACIVLLLIWYLASMILHISVIPSPFLVLSNFFDIFISDIAIHAAYSLFRIFCGILLSALIGVPIGLLMGYYESFDKKLSPFVYLLYPIPKIALLPIVMLLAGIGEASKIIMITLIVLFQVIVAARDSVKSIPKETYYSIYSLGPSRWDIFKHIVIPASLPGLLTSVRISLGTAISVLFFTETFGTEYGMGYFIMDAWMRVNYVEMYSGIVAISLMGLLLFVLVDALGKKL